MNLRLTCKSTTYFANTLSFFDYFKNKLLNRNTKPLKKIVVFLDQGRLGACFDGDLPWSKKCSSQVYALVLPWSSHAFMQLSPDPNMYCLFSFLLCNDLFIEMFTHKNKSALKNERTIYIIYILFFIFLFVSKCCQICCCICCRTWYMSNPRDPWKY